MLSFTLVFQSVPPLLTLVREDFQASHAQVGLLMSLFALPGIFLSLPGGAVSDRFGMKKTGLASLGLMVAGTVIFAASQIPLHAYVGRVISGVGGLTLAVVLPQMVSRWFMGKELGLAMGLYNTAMPFGTVFSLNVFNVLGNSFGWRVPVVLTTAVGGIALLAFLLLFKEPSEDVERTGSTLREDVARLGPSMWLVGLSWMWFNAALISFITFSPDYFVDKGFAVGSAGFMSSIVMLGSLFLNPVVGYVVHRFGGERLFIAAGGLGLSILFFLVPAFSLVIPLLVLVGVFASLVPPSVFSLPPKIVDARSFGLAYGIITTCLNVGILAGPYLVGSARDLTGDYALGFHLMVAFAVMQTLTIGLFGLTMRRRGKKV
jgi:MFS family permease